MKDLISKMKKEHNYCKFISSLIETVIADEIEDLKVNTKQTRLKVYKDIIEAMSIVELDLIHKARRIDSEESIQ